jgi:hypothetical protein
VAAGTHEAVSTDVGTTSPDGVYYASSALWFVDDGGRPYRLPEGGSPQPIWLDVERAFDPLSANSLTAAQVAAIQVRGYPWYGLVAFFYGNLTMAYVGSTITGHTLVVHARDGQPISWWESAVAGTRSLVGELQDSTTGRVTLATVVSNTVVSVQANGASAYTDETPFTMLQVLHFAGQPDTVTHFDHVDLDLLVSRAPSPPVTGQVRVGFAAAEDYASFSVALTDPASFTHGTVAQRVHRSVGVNAELRGGFVTVSSLGTTLGWGVGRIVTTGQTTPIYPSKT